MEPGDAWQLGTVLILLALSMLISMAETAFLSVNRIRLRHMEEERIPGAEGLRKLTDNIDPIRESTRLGIHMLTIGASALAAGFGYRMAGDAGVLAALVASVVMTLVLNEGVAKVLAMKNPEGVSIRLTGFGNGITALLSPVRALLAALSDGMLEWRGIRPERPYPYTGEDIRASVNVAHEEGILEDEEEKMIHNVFEFRESQVKDVMTPRTDMAAIPVSASYEQVLGLFREEQFSRIPVYQETPDDIIGILTVKDLFLNSHVASDEPFDIYQHMREAYFTYEFKPVGELMKEMQARHLAIAVVLDEYGGTAGIVTMEDLVEEIVGEIRDEYDAHEQDIEVVRENEFIVEGSTRIDEVNDLIGTHFESEDFDSIGGYLLGSFGRLPEVGERREVEGITFVVEQVDKNRIESLRIIVV